MVAVFVAVAVNVIVVCLVHRFGLNWILLLVVVLLLVLLLLLLVAMR